VCLAGAIALEILHLLKVGLKAEPVELEEPNAED